MFLKLLNTSKMIHLYSALQLHTLTAATMQLDHQEQLVCCYLLIFCFHFRLTPTG